MHLGIELEKDAWGNQRRFWARVNGNKKERARMSRICSRDGRILMEEEELRELWEEHCMYGKKVEKQERDVTQ